MGHRFARRPKGWQPMEAPTTPATAAFSADALLARILYRDGLMLVLDKPAGIPVHAGPGGGPNLEALFEHLRFGLPHPPALAHRLDRDTSGCLILGRHRKALVRLGRLFAAGAVGKTYWAVVHGRPPADSGRIEAPLTKLSRRQTGWRMIVDPAGRPAVTDYAVRGRSATTTWLELRPQTGRTHQIRVHCQQLGCPVVGDALYGPPAAREGVPPVLLLHARRVVIPLYPQRPPITINAPPPAAMRQALARLDGFDADAGSADGGEAD